MCPGLSTSSAPLSRPSTYAVLHNNFWIDPSSFCSCVLVWKFLNYLQKQIGSVTQQLRYTETNKTLRTSGRSAWAFKVKMFSYLRVNYAGTLSQVIRAGRQQNFTAEPLTWPRETNKRISEWPTTDELILSEAFSTCP